MIAIRKREDSRNYFPHSVKRKPLPVVGIAAVRRIGPHWIVAGRRPRIVPVFFIRTTVLSVRVAS